MQERKPIKRKIELQSFSKEHHHSFLLCWKIRTGLKEGISPMRIKKYVDWFYDLYVLPHFKAEETLIFPILGKDNELIKKALTDHRRLTRLFVSKKDIRKTLSLLEEELDRHIRFEERILFQKIQDIATSKELQLIHESHLESKFDESFEDEFW